MLLLMLLVRWMLMNALMLMTSFTLVQQHHPTTFTVALRKHTYMTLERSLIRAISFFSLHPSTTIHSSELTTS